MYARDNMISHQILKNHTIITQYAQTEHKQKYTPKYKQYTSTKDSHVYQPLQGLSTSAQFFCLFSFSPRPPPQTPAPRRPSTDVVITQNSLSQRPQRPSRPQRPQGDPCQPNPCGANAECSVKGRSGTSLGRAVCSCPQVWTLTDFSPGTS